MGTGLGRARSTFPGQEVRAEVVQTKHVVTQYIGCGLLPWHCSGIPKNPLQWALCLLAWLQTGYCVVKDSAVSLVVGWYLPSFQQTKTSVPRPKIETTTLVCTSRDTRGYVTCLNLFPPLQSLALCIGSMLDKEFPSYSKGTNTLHSLLLEQRH